MDLQNLFYLFGIIFMLTFLGILLFVVIIVWYVRKKALQLIRKPQDAVSDVVTALALRLKSWGK